MSRAVESWLSAHPLPISGRRAAVLGATGSLGREIAGDLARMGARVTLLARDTAKAERLADKLRQTGARVDTERVDLARLESVRDYVERERKRGEPIAALLLIAGVFRKPGSITPDGYEQHYQVNFLGPAALALLLAPSLAPDARVAVMTSLAAFHAMGSEQDPQSRGERSAIRVYARSKRLLTLCALALAREGLPVTLAHPGVSATDLFAAGTDAPAFGKRFLRVALPLMRGLFMPPEKAALPAVYALSLPVGRMAHPRGLWQVWGLPADGAPGRLGQEREAQSAALVLVKKALQPPENGTE